VDDIESIHVFKDAQGVYWAHSGNRRLYIFKRLQRLGIVATIPVYVLCFGNSLAQLYRAEMTTENEGLDILVRDSFAVHRIEAIESEWRRAGQCQPLKYDQHVPTSGAQRDVIDELSSLSLTETHQGGICSSVQSTPERYRLEVAAEPKGLLENKNGDTYAQRWGEVEDDSEELERYANE